MVPRPPREIDDPTPLDGSRIDLASRVGWLLRTTRQDRQVGLLDLRERLAEDGTEGTSVSALSRAEITGERHSRRIAGYERALGLAYGSLRAPIDVLYRTYDYRPPDHAALVPDDSLIAFSAACEQVGATGEVTGQDWMRFAEFHAEGRFGLPAAQAEILIAQLAAELQRAVGLGYQQRYDALARLRCSAYGDVTLSVVRSILNQPGVQRIADLMSAICEQPTVQVLRWCQDLLTDDSELTSRAACLGLQNLRTVGGISDADWASVAPQIAAAAERVSEHPMRGPILASTLATSPPALRLAVPTAVRSLLPQPPRAERWTRNRLNIRYTQAMTLAERIAAGRPGEALLGRLLFEILFDFRATHAVTSSFLVGASVFAEQTVAAVAEIALSDEDAFLRARATEAFTNLMLPTDAIDPAPHLASNDPDVLRAGLRIAEFGGHEIPADHIRTAVMSLTTRHDALSAAGMAQHPVLSELAEDPSYDETVRSRAAWWQRAGGRVIDPVSPG